MKTQLLKKLATISFLIAIAMLKIGSAQAQSLADEIRVNIPFEFTIADKKLPAGKYSISRSPQSTNDSVLRINNAAGHIVAVRLTNAVQSLNSKRSGTVVFHRYGDQYFLAQVWPAGSNRGRVLIKSRTEREAERAATLAMKERAPVMETVSITNQP